MKTVVKTQHGDKMELVTDNNGNKIRTQGQIKTRDEKLTLWKVRFSLFLILILISKIFRELLKLLKNFVLSILQVLLQLLNSTVCKVNLQSLHLLLSCLLNVSGKTGLIQNILTNTEQEGSGNSDSKLKSLVPKEENQGRDITENMFAGKFQKWHCLLMQ